MNKYKLINQQTGGEHLCDKVEIEGFDYYVSDEKPKNGDFAIYKSGELIHYVVQLNTDNLSKVIATTNPNIDIPKVINEVDQYTMAQNYAIKTKSPNREAHRQGFVKGYNKSQETHPFSEQDMVEFKIWCDNNAGHNWLNLRYKSTKELLQLWKEQKPKVLYYN